jgi:hypothetical protein
MAMRKIGIFGDSFGFQKKDEPYASWVDLLTNYADIVNHSECRVALLNPRNHCTVQPLKKTMFSGQEYYAPTYL